MATVHHLQGPLESLTLRGNESYSSTSYSGMSESYSSDHSAQSHSAQSHSGQSHSGQSHSGQSHSGQSHSGQSHSGHSHSGQSHSGQSHSEQSHSGHSHSGQSHSGQSMHSRNSGHSRSGESHSGKSHSDSNLDDSFERHEVCSGYLNDYSDFEASLCHQRRYSFAETVDTNLSLAEERASLDSFPKLTEPDQVPWGEQEVLNVLREGRTKRFSSHITVEMMEHLSSILKRPLARLTREASRLSMAFAKCTRHEMQASVRSVLSHSLADSCLQACMKALALYAMGGETLRQSKSCRCSLKFSVGAFHRWMLDSHVAVRVHEYAAVFLAACMENLLEEIVLLAFIREPLGDTVFTLETLKQNIEQTSELWGLLQPYDHLMAGRNSAGIVSLPASLNLPEPCRNDRVKNRQIEGQLTNPMGKSVEQSLLATCVGSLTELGDIMTQALHHLYSRGPTPGCGGVPSPRARPLTATPEALHTLYYYLRCPQLEQQDNPGFKSPTSHMHQDRPWLVVAPVVEWLRVAGAQAQYRGSWVMDAGDIQQAARVLLPNTDTPPRPFGSPDEALALSRHLDAQKCVVKFRQDLAFRMLASGRSDLIPEAVLLLGRDGITAHNEQGLTPLMCACLRGDEAMVHILVEAGAPLDTPVPSDLHKYPCVHPETKSWTAITFAATRSHLAIVQLLLERGASIEGAVKPGEENSCETPLQLAAAAGDYELVSLLLSKGADPYLSTLPRNGVSFTYIRGGYNAFLLAASHGHRNVVRKLLSHPLSGSNAGDMLSLEEMLAEGRNSSFRSQTPSLQHQSRQTQLPKQDYRRKCIANDNAYMTIDDIAEEMEKVATSLTSYNHHNSLTDNNNRHQHSLTSNSSKNQTTTSNKNGNSVTNIAALSRAQHRSLQEALYHSAENGYLEIALELRNLGIPWSTHSWGCCLSAAYQQSRKALVITLLKDVNPESVDDLNSGFISETVPLLVSMFKRSKRDPMSTPLSELLCNLYGQEEIEAIPQSTNKPTAARIDSRYVNNPEMSDVQFVIEGKMFHAHKIILVNASSRFRAMLSSRFCEGSQAKIELNDVRYRIFEYMMHYLYKGGIEQLHIDSKDILELLGSANFFMLEGLQRHCEALCAEKLNFDNSVAIYKQAKLYHSLELMAYCEGYFLQNLPSLLTHGDSFRKLLYSSKMASYDLSNGLLATLSQRLQRKLSSRNAQPHTPR